MIARGGQQLIFQHRIITMIVLAGKQAVVDIIAA